MYLRNCVCFVLVAGLSLSALGKDKDKHVADELFTGPVPNLRIEIPEAGMEILRQYNQVWRQTRPERIDVKATVREGDKVYKNVAIHLKGSFSFQGIDAKPSMTLHFDKFEKGQNYHGLTKIHINNSVQDSTALCEQFAREIFKEMGIVAPRAGPALVHLNGRDFGLCVIVEGMDKHFLARHYRSTKGNLYDGGAGGDIDKDLNVISGEKRDDRSDIKELIAAIGETDPAKRLERIGKTLDIDEFVTFAAIEAAMVHWDGYCIGCNNYQVFNDISRGKLIFLPHGMDQLYGTSNSPEMSLTPIFGGMVARALLTIPEVRLRYLKRVQDLSNKEMTAEALQEHLDKLAKRLRAALDQNGAQSLDTNVEYMKARIRQRLASIAAQLQNPPRPVRLAKDGVLSLKDWRYKADNLYTSRGGRSIVDEREILRIIGGGDHTYGGSWRTRLYLDEGHYEFSGRVRSEGLAGAQGIRGIMLRISGETKTDGFAANAEWRTETYAFDVRGLEQIEFVCEFRGPEGSGEIDASTLRLRRKGPATKAPERLIELDNRK